MDQRVQNVFFLFQVNKMSRHVEFTGIPKGSRKKKEPLQPTGRGEKVTKWDLKAFDKKCWNKYYDEDSEQSDCDSFANDFLNDESPNLEFYTRCAQTIMCPDPSGGVYGSSFGSDLKMMETSLKPQRFHPSQEQTPNKEDKLYNLRSEAIVIADEMSRTENKEDYEVLNKSLIMVLIDIALL